MDTHLSCLPSNQHEIRELAIVRSLDARARARRASKKVRADSCDPEKLHLTAIKAPSQVGPNRVKSRKLVHAMNRRQHRPACSESVVQSQENDTGHLLQSSNDKLKQEYPRSLELASHQGNNGELPQMDLSTEADVFTQLDQLLGTDSFGDISTGDAWASPSLRATASLCRRNPHRVTFVGCGTREDAGAASAHKSRPVSRSGMDQQVHSFPDKADSAVSSGHSTPRARSPAECEADDAVWTPSGPTNIKRPARAPPASPTKPRVRVTVAPGRQDFLKESLEQAAEIADQLWSSQASHRGYQIPDKEDASPRSLGKKRAQRGVNEVASSGQVPKTSTPTAMLTMRGALAQVSQSGSSPSHGSCQLSGPTSCDDSPANMALFKRLREKEDGRLPIGYWSICRRLDCDSATGGSPKANVVIDERTEKLGALAKKHTCLRLSRKLIGASAESPTNIDDRQAATPTGGDAKSPCSPATFCSDNSRPSTQQSQKSSCPSLGNFPQSTMTLGRPLNLHSVPSVSAAPRDDLFGVVSRSASATRGAPTELGEALSAAGKSSTLSKSWSSPSIGRSNSRHGSR